MVEMYHTEDGDERSDVLDDAHSLLTDIADRLEREHTIHFLPQVFEATNPYLDPRIEAEVYPFESLIGGIQKTNGEEIEVYVRVTPDGDFHNMSAWDDGEDVVLADSVEQFIEQMTNYC